MRSVTGRVDVDHLENRPTRSKLGKGAPSPIVLSEIHVEGEGDRGIMNRIAECAPVAN